MPVFIRMCHVQRTSSFTSDIFLKCISCVLGKELSILCSHFCKLAATNLLVPSVVERSPILLSLSVNLFQSGAVAHTHTHVSSEHALGRTLLVTTLRLSGYGYFTPSLLISCCGFTRKCNSCMVRSPRGNLLLPVFCINYSNATEVVKWATPNCSRPQSATDSAQ